MANCKIECAVCGQEYTRDFHESWKCPRCMPDDVRTLKARLASADIEATSLLMAMVQQWPDVHPDWKPLPDVAGKITQINNMVAGLRARLTEAEATASTANHGHEFCYEKLLLAEARLAELEQLARQVATVASDQEVSNCIDEARRLVGLTVSADEVQK